MRAREWATSLSDGFFIHSLFILFFDSSRSNVVYLNAMEIFLRRYKKQIQIFFTIYQKCWKVRRIFMHLKFFLQDFSTGTAKSDAFKWREKQN